MNNEMHQTYGPVGMQARVDGSFCLCETCAARLTRLGNTASPALQTARIDVPNVVIPDSTALTLHCSSSELASLA